jgi:hypothetical protein
MGRAGVTPPRRHRSPGGVEEEQLVHDRFRRVQLALDPRRGTLLADRIAGNIAIDSLDTFAVISCSPGTPRSRAVLGAAGVLADDQLYVNTASGRASKARRQGNAVGIPNNDCGGRTPLEDTIDVTYSVLAIGALTGVGDGIPVDADGTASITVFPYLDSPN